MNSVMLSIYVPTYNHEKYIIKALDSILMQKTHYTYEVLVGEDNSTDKTRLLLQQYEQIHPGFLKVYYREKNMYKKIPNNARDLIARCKGKYLIGLEGDDYWTDELKIEKQISFLENHPEYIGISHDCIVVNSDSNIINEKYPSCKENEYSLKHFMSNIFPGQLTTIMYRNIYIDPNIDTSILDIGLIPGDRLLFFLLIMYGKIYCLQESMSAYRHITNNGASYSANYHYIFREEEHWYKCLLQYSKQFGVVPQKYIECLYIRCLFKGYRKKQCSLNQLFTYMKNIKYIHYSLIMWLIYKFKKDIFHCKIWI